jgi:hypothetical protein
MRIAIEHGNSRRGVLDEQAQFCFALTARLCPLRSVMS